MSTEYIPIVPEVTDPELVENRADRVSQIEQEHKEELPKTGGITSMLWDYKFYILIVVAIVVVVFLLVYYFGKKYRGEQPQVPTGPDPQMVGIQNSPTEGKFLSKEEIMKNLQKAKEKQNAKQTAPPVKPAQPKPVDTPKPAPPKPVDVPKQSPPKPADTPKPDDLHASQAEEMQSSISISKPITQHVTFAVAEVSDLFSNSEESDENLPPMTVGVVEFELPNYVKDVQQSPRVTEILSGEEEISGSGSDSSVEKCHGTTKGGGRCKNKAFSGKFCRFHGGQNTKA